MATTVESYITENGTWIATVTAGKNESVTVEVPGSVQDVCAQVRRTNGSTQTGSLTGSNDGMNFVALTSKTQGAVSGGDGGGDTTLTGLTAALHQLRQRPRYLRLTVTNTTDGADDVLEAIFVGATRR